MAVVRPFHGFHYSLERFGKDAVSKLMAPPYDVISEKDQKMLEQGPHNIIHVTLGKNGSGYTDAAHLFHSWIQEGIIQKDPSPCFYIYEQDYRVNSHPDEKKRTGFMGLVRLEDYEKRIIMPHEKTMPKYSLDRLDLLRSTRANLEQIFGVYNDSTGKIDAILEKNKKDDKLLFQFQDFQGTIHKIWTLSDRKDIEQVRLFMNPRTIIIADGHHRYETSMMYRREVRERTENPLEDIPEDYVMMTLINIKNPGLLILPTHRLIHSLPEPQVKGFFDRARQDLCR
ncbi:MAG: DUF1015 domain-containing protein [Candidatus Atribacteria bacterium]|nr:DUF1015 domain-containing protein [Candidatus Atribacteria bacterium]